MAISIVNPNPSTFGFVINATSSDASGCEELMAAPAAGTSIVIDKLTINTSAPITVTVGEGETAGAVTTALIGPIDMAGHSIVQFDFGGGGLILSSATSLTVDTSGAGNICVVAQGRVI